MYEKNNKNKEKKEGFTHKYKLTCIYETTLLLDQLWFDIQLITFFARRRIGVIYLSVVDFKTFKVSPIKIFL